MANKPKEKIPALDTAGMQVTSAMINGDAPCIEAIAADVFPVLLENFLRFGGRCTPNGYSDVTPESVTIITNQAALIAEQHVDAMAKWRERQNAPKKPNPDEGQERLA